MEFISLEDAKKHLNIEFSDDDSYINDLIKVAFSAVQTHTGRDFTISEIPAPVKHAGLLLIGNLYANREPVAFGQAYKVLYSYEYLLAPYIKYWYASREFK